MLVTSSKAKVDVPFTYCYYFLFTKEYIEFIHPKEGFPWLKMCSNLLVNSRDNFFDLVFKQT